MTQNQNAKSSADFSANFIERFAALAKRLASIGVAVHTANLEWGSFGSWTLMVMKHNEAVRFIYDGLDSRITIEASPVRKYSYPNKWKELLVKGIDKRRNDALTFIEDFIRKRFAV